MSTNNWNTQPGRRYLLELLAAMSLYVLLLFLSIHLLTRQNFSQPLLTLVAVMPAFPLFLVMAAVIRFGNSIDELQRRIHMEALAFAGGATALVAITYGFLENAGFPRLPAYWVFVSVNIFWIIARPFIGRRYS